MTNEKNLLIKPLQPSQKHIQVNIFINQLINKK